MARYIDADKFMERLKASPAFSNIGMDGYFLLDVVEELLKKFPTADVAPKSEVARLEQDVTRLVQENEDLKDSNEHLAVMLEETKIELEAMRGAANSYKMHYENLAREIFEEIEKIIEKSKYQQATPFGTEERYNPYVIVKQVAELKKKYTEERE